MMKAFGKKTSSKKPLLVADFDRIVSEPVAFKFGGKIHEIKPITQKEFYSVADAISKLWATKDQENLTANDLCARYHEIIASVCDTVSLKDVRSMTQAQMTGLFNLVCDAVTGKIHAPTDPLPEKKN